MYICSCNGLTDLDVQTAIEAGATRPSEVYAARKCRAQCGNCVNGVKCLLRDALKQKQEQAHAHTLPVMADYARHGSVSAVA